MQRNAVLLILIWVGLWPWLGLETSPCWGADPYLAPIPHPAPPQDPGPALTADGAGAERAPLKHKLRKWLEDHAEAITLYARWAVGAPLLVVATVIGLLMRPRRPQEMPPGAVSFDPPGDAPIDPLVPPTPRRVEPAPAKPAAKPRPPGKLSDQVQLLRFFLLLFKRQQQADPEAPAQIERVETRPTCPDEIYEMRIMHGDEWLTRRMSLGLLGLGGGSRSRCFYVIYDTHMVIKIPPAPLTRFSDYKRQIAAESHIVARLAPRPCIIPRVSVILKAVHGFPQSQGLSEEQLEAEYIQLLESQSDFQDYLKINGSFAFFMDLAKHFFLSSVLEEIHSGYGRLIEEARQHPELLWDSDGFAARYGDEAGAVCHALQEAYGRCEAGLRRLVEQAGAGKSVSNYHMRQWFLTHVVGESIRREEHDLPAEMIARANHLLDDAVQANQRSVARYRRLLSEYIRRTRFSQYRRQLENICSNILELLACIGRQKLALRDLKPENLFVAGSRDEYPAFLNDPRKFSIGLIDVETAVAFDAADPILIPQPQLAGTPLYATPTHLMDNAVLLEVYGDLPVILHMQDWFATIAILYRSVAGENLFATTAHAFPEILNRLKLIDPAGPELVQEIARVQKLFWNSATAEFNVGMTRFASIFSLVEVDLPADWADWLVPVLEAETKEISCIISKALEDQTFFPGGDKRRFLKEASADKIGQMKNKLSQEVENGESQSQVLLYFEILEKMKTRLESKQRALANVSSPRAILPLDQLLQVMFQKVFEAMYLPDWPELTPKLYGSSTFLTTDVATYQATM